MDKRCDRCGQPIEKTTVTIYTCLQNTDEMIEWAEENDIFMNIIHQRYSSDGNVIVVEFFNSIDAMAFKLRWL